MLEISNAINFANINHTNLNLKLPHVAKQWRDIAIFLNQILKLQINSETDCTIESCEGYLFICIEYMSFEQGAISITSKKFQISYCTWHCPITTTKTYAKVMIKQ